MVTNDLLLWAQAGQQGGGGQTIVLLIYIAIAVLVVIGWWKVFEKAGQPGWGALIPIYNAYLLCKVAGRPGWWVILLLIPCVSFIFFIIVSIDVARNFGKGGGFAVGLFLLPFIFFPILGFGDARYQPATTA